MDTALSIYLESLRYRYSAKRFPNFCGTHSDDVSQKEILVVLQDPGNSGAEETQECSIENPDPTSDRQRKIVKKLQISRSKILFWNFFPYYDWEETYEELNSAAKKNEQIRWANELRKLAVLMDNLRVIICCGQQAWEGMKYFEPICCVPMLWVPHPAPLGLQTDPSMTREKKIILYNKGWEKAASLINGEFRQKLRL